MRNPDGEARQVPTHHTWAASYWVTRDGIVRKRHWHFAKQRWSWEAESLMPAEEINSRGDQTGRLGVYIDHWKSLEHIIALAWIPRCEGSMARVQRELGKPLHKRYLSWKDGGEAATEEPRHVSGETWGRLSWRCGCVPCPDSYEISSIGRIRSPSGEISSGFWFDERRWAYVPEGGLVDLNAAANLSRVVDVPPRVRTTLDALLCGETPLELSRALAIKEDTAWAYAWDSCRHLSPRQIWSIAKRIVSPDLLYFMAEMQMSNHPFPAKLLDLMSRVENALPDDSNFLQQRCKFGMLRFAKMALQAGRE